MSSLVALDDFAPVATQTAAFGPACIDLTAISAEPDLLVSVIIPCYNGEAFLGEAIESALAQSYPHVEIIVVDDGSTDRSGEIALAYPIRYFRQSNQGLTPSRNLGIRESRGSYLVFLDADDRLKPHAIEVGLRTLAQHPECAMSVGNHLFVSADGAYLASSRKICLATAHYEALLKSNFVEMISTVLFRKSVFEKVGGFDTQLRVAEDYELYLRIARDHAICCHPEVIAEYRLHKTNASHNSELMLTMTLQVLKRQVRYVRGNPSRLLAFVEGIRGWRKQYGRQLAAELARSLPTLQTGHLRRKLLLLLGYYPQGLMVVLVLRYMPGWDRRKSTQISQSALLAKPIWQKLYAWANSSKPQSFTSIG